MIGHPDGLKPLGEMLIRTEDEQVVQGATKAIAKIGGEEATKALASKLLEMGAQF